MGHLGAYWVNISKATAGLMRINTKRAKMDALKDKIRIWWKRFGWNECETRWTFIDADNTRAG